MMQDWGIRYESDTSGFVLSLSGPLGGGWHSALMEVDGGNLNEEVQSAARKILKEQGFYRPNDNWSWKEVSTVYMKKATTYHEIRVRKSDWD